MVALFRSPTPCISRSARMIDHHARFGQRCESNGVVDDSRFAFAWLRPPLPDWLGVTFKLVGDGLIPLMLLSLAATHGHRMARCEIDSGRIVCPVTGLPCCAAGPFAAAQPDADRLAVPVGALPLPCSTSWSPSSTGRSP